MVAAGWEGCAAGTHLWAAEGPSEAAAQHVPVGMWLCPPHATGHAHMMPVWGPSTVACAAEEEIGLAFHLLWGCGHYKLDLCMLVVHHLLRN